MITVLASEIVVFISRLLYFFALLKEEIKTVIKMIKEFPEFLDGKEIWILENYAGGLI